MRVTIVSETFAPQVNGVSRTLGQLARVLEEVGDAVQRIHPNYGVCTAGPDDCLVRSVRPPFYPELRVPVPPFPRVARAIGRFQPDLIHVATEGTLGFHVLRLAIQRRIPVVSSFHTYFDQYSAHYNVGWARGLVWRYLRWFHNQTRETYVPSRPTITALEARGFERLVLWPRGVDSQLFRPDRAGRQRVRQALGIGTDQIVIGHVGRIAAEKNIAYLGGALEQVARSRPQVRLLIVGDGPERPALQARLGPAACFAGYRSGEDLADHYAACDLFAFASRTETFGNVILEAMASGLPVIALRAGGPADTVLHGSTGLLLDPAAAASDFARVLIELTDDRSRRERMARAAREYALGQSWEAVMRALRERYLRVVEESGSLTAACA